MNGPRAAGGGDGSAVERTAGVILCRFGKEPIVAGPVLRLIINHLSFLT